MPILSNPFNLSLFSRGEQVNGFLGLDGGSTSSKCVVLNESGELLLKVYQLSKGNPLQDMKEMLTKLNDTVSQQGAQLVIQGVRRYRLCCRCIGSRP